MSALYVEHRITTDAETTLPAELLCVESAREKRRRLGWRPLTVAERDEQLRRNLDDVCPAASTEEP